MQDEDWSRDGYTIYKHRQVIDWDPELVRRSEICLRDLASAADIFLKEHPEHRNRREEFWDWLERQS